MACRLFPGKGLGEKCSCACWNLNWSQWPGHMMNFILNLAFIFAESSWVRLRGWLLHEVVKVWSSRKLLFQDFDMRNWNHIARRLFSKPQENMSHLQDGMMKDWELELISWLIKSTWKKSPNLSSWQFGCENLNMPRSGTECHLSLKF